MSVLPPRGFRLAGVHCGIKRNPNKEDVTLIVADAPAVAAGVYTQNLVFAAPVALDRQRTPSDNIRAILANSGNANACTGQRGLDDARRMTELAAQACGIKPEQVLVLSTGIIGEFLPLAKIEAGVSSAAQRLATDEAAFVAAARGITTTDKSHKMAARVIEISSGPVRISGMAKGAGMIGPRMATMLGILLTDAALTPGDAQQALTWAVDDSFNCISVEGHMSTNDTVLLLASGAASRSPLAGADLAAFRQALLEVCIDLARAIPDDGEGASHLITIEVRGCAARADAHRIAKTIAESALVKTAIAGGDPNWGRIVSAAGYAGPRFDPAKVNLTINGHQLYRAGAPVPFDARTVSESIRENRESHVVLELAEGDAGIRFWTSDLTAEYLKINSEYHT